MQTSTDIVSLPAAATASTSTALALAGDAVTEEEYHKRVKDAEDLEKKLTYINQHVPSKIQNVCGSSAGAGSGDFHQYRMIRRHEQMRLKRMDEEWDKEQQKEEFEQKRKEREEEAEQRTAKRRAKRVKKKGKKKSKKPGGSGAAGGQGTGTSSSDEGEPEQAALD